jgi:serine/threonine protein kinase
MKVNEKVTLGSWDGITTIQSTQHYPKCGHTSTTAIRLFPDVHKTGSAESKWLYFYGFAAAVFVTEILFFTSAWMFVLRREWRPVQSLEGYKVISNHFRQYSYNELKTATANFKIEVGRGSSGVIYKGILDDNSEIAVKRLENVRRGKQEFQSELRIIARINHMNLARIWGFCSEGSHRMIVYEYIENDSLSNILFKNHILLDWKQRFNIDVGIAKGLAYLHHECLEWVVHCDVKPDNILLDQDFEAKIIDFGLEKLVKRNESNQVTSQVRGTVGYITPEWISGLPITAKVDVYSYGVVLLELVSGTRASDMSAGVDDELHMELRNLARILADKVNREEQSWIGEFADYRLDGQLNCLQARTLIKLAVSCLEEDKNKRPTMETIVETLLSSAEADDAIK